jgi:hypothetical protein
MVLLHLNARHLLILCLLCKQFMPNSLFRTSFDLSIGFNFKNGYILKTLFYIPKITANLSLHSNKNLRIQMLLV